MGVPEDDAVLGHLGRGQTGEAEVHDLHLAGRLDVDVRRFQVPVNDALGVRKREAGHDLLHDPELLIEGCQITVGQGVPEVLALQELHGHVDEALLLPEVVDGDDVRVAEDGRGLRLAVKALPRFLRGPEAVRESLDGDKAPQHRVLGLEDTAHRPTADLVQYPILADAIELHRGDVTPMRNGGRGEERRGRGLRRGS